MRKLLLKFGGEHFEEGIPSSDKPIKESALEKTIPTKFYGDFKERYDTASLMRAGMDKKLSELLGLTDRAALIPAQDSKLAGN